MGGLPHPLPRAWRPLAGDDAYTGSVCERAGNCRELARSVAPQNSNVR